MNLKISRYIYIIYQSNLKKNIYQIGLTRKNPPHQILWQYPNGSFFICLYPTSKCEIFLKSLRADLIKNSNIIWRTDLGLEYFEGDLQIIIDTLDQLYEKYEPNGLQIIRNQTIDDQYLQSINGSQYHQILKQKSMISSSLYNYKINVRDLNLIDSELINTSYEKKRKTHKNNHLSKLKKILSKKDPNKKK